jgi:predicted GNAT superfamily acetyltransferase
MEITYQHLVGLEYIPELLSLQKEIFGLTEKNLITAPMLSVYLREEHPLGCIVGCIINHDDHRELIGLTIFAADMLEHSMYLLLGGMLPKYQNKQYGRRLFFKTREIALEHNVKTLYGAVETLDAKIGRFFLNLGGLYIQYIQMPYKLSVTNQQAIQVPLDKMLYCWPLINDVVDSKLDESNNKNEFNKYPVLNIINKSNHDAFLIEIPNNYNQLLNENPQEALNWRLETRELFSHYINNNNYYVTSCLTKEVDKYGRRFYYLLEKKSNKVCEQTQSIYN